MPQATVSGVAVVSVTIDSPGHLIWTFTDTVASVSNADSLQADGQLPTSIDGFAANQIEVDYGVIVSAGAPWEALPGLGDIIFDSGLPLLPQIGNVL